MGIKTYKDIASMQNPGGQRTGKAKGGRVRKQVGGQGPVRGPNVQLTAAQQRGVARQGRPDPMQTPPMPVGPQRPTGGLTAAEQQRLWTPYKPGGAKGGKVSKATGGRVKKQRGSSVDTMASGKKIQWQTGPVGQRRRQDYMNYMAPKAAKRQLAKQPPGRKAANIGPGGWSTGGKVAKATGGRVKKRSGGAQGTSAWKNAPIKGMPEGWSPPTRPTRPTRIKLTPAQLRARAAKRSLRKNPPPKRLGATGPGYKKGGRVTRARGGKAKR